MDEQLRAHVFRERPLSRDTTLRTASLPQNVTAVTISSAATGTANVNTSSCAQGKTQCTTQEYLLTTTDGGATWTRQ